MSLQIIIIVAAVVSAVVMAIVLFVQFKSPSPEKTARLHCELTQVVNELKGHAEANPNLLFGDEIERRKKRLKWLESRKKKLTKKLGVQ